MDCIFCVSMLDMIEGVDSSESKIKEMATYKHAYTNTTNDTTCKQHRGILSPNLKASPKSEDNDGDHHRILPGNAIGKVAIEERSSPSSEL